MQSSSQQGATDTSFVDHLEELCWENGQLLLEKVQSKDPLEGSASASQFSMSTTMQLAETTHSLEMAGNTDRGATELPVHVPGAEMIDWVHDCSSHEQSIAMQRNNMLVSTYSYQPLEAMNRRDILQQERTSRVDPESVARTLCIPSLGSELPNVQVGLNMPIMLSIQPSMMQKHDDRSSDAILNSLSLRCMTSSPIQSSQNTLFTQSSSDALVFNAARIDPITHLQGASKGGSSHVSVDVSRASDLESVLLDSSELTHISFACRSGHSPNKSSRPVEVAGNKKARAIDDFDSESEGSYDDAVALKKPRLEHSSSIKRTRAADTHNLSERNRRGRINEKLKALQELIPNANKTDKASVLSEAIDYLKKLRLQLQVLCCRSGLSLSPLLVSQGANHLQMPSVGTGVNRGTQAGIDFGVNTTSSFPSFSVSPNIGSAAQACSGSMGLPELRISAEAQFTSTNALNSSGIPASYGPTVLTPLDSFHNPFQV